MCFGLRTGIHWIINDETDLCKFKVQSRTAGYGAPGTDADFVSTVSGSNNNLNEINHREI